MHKDYYFYAYCTQTKVCSQDHDMVCLVSNDLEQY